MEVSAPPPAHDERTMALLMYLLSILSGLLVPIIFFFVKRDSKFVGFHSLQMIFFHLGYMLLMMVCMVAWFAVIFGTIAHGAMSHSQAPPVGIFIAFPLIWGTWMLAWMINLLVCIVFGIKAHNGEWPALPLLGRWARNVIKV